MLNENQKWILFYIFIIAFTAITALTIWGVFFGLENLEQEYKKALFASLIIELVGVVMFLFKTSFTSGAVSTFSRKMWLDFGEGEDVKKYIGKDVSISPRGEDGNPISDDLINKILDDRGLYVKPELPSDTVNVFITMELDENVFEGSISVQSYSVRLEGEMV